MPKKSNTRNNQRIIKTRKDSSDDEEEEWTSESSTSDSDKKNKKPIAISESDTDSSDEEYLETEEDDSDSSENESDEMPAKEVFDPKEYKKFLAELFPSKYSKEEVKKSIRPKTNSKRVVDSDEEKSSDEVVKSKKEKQKEKRNKKQQKKKQKRKEKESDSESEIKNSSESEKDTETTTDSDEMKNDQKKINIIFTIGAPGTDQLTCEEREAYETYNPDEEEEEEEDCDTEDEETFMKETFERVELPKISNPDSTTNVSSENPSEEAKPSIKKNRNQKEEEIIINTNIEPEYKEMLDLKKDLMVKYKKNPKNRILRRAIKDCTKEIHELVKIARTKNTKEYRKLIHGGANYVSEIDYFKTRLSNKEQLQIMEQMKKINEQINIDKPYRLSLLQSNIPAKYKSTAMQKLNILRTMESSDPEYYKMKNWVDTFMRIPFCEYKTLSVSLNDGIDACHHFMQNAKQTLDDCVYGLDDAKLQILQMVGQWVSNPSAMGTAIAIKGPPGTGKTSLVKEGISKILGREFAFIALGGAGDSSFLEGHSYTYEGSTWGRIVQILIDSKCMNPVIYFDELDKISDTPRGQEIVGILTHLTDTSQNSEFHDKYFSDVAFDLSKCLFIFSYNDESLVNPILKDRMYRIQTKGYDVKEKTIIAQKYLLPKIREQVNFTAEEVIIPDDTIQYIVSTPRFTRGEDGVRNLKRCLEIIHTKLNLFRLVKSDDNIFAKDIGQHVEFPFTVLRKHVDVFIKNEETQNQSLLAMYI